MKDLDDIRAGWSVLVEAGKHRRAVPTPSDPLAQRDPPELIAFCDKVEELLQDCEIDSDGDTLIINGTIVITP